MRKKSSKFWRKNLGPYSPTSLKSILFLFLEDFVNFKPYGLANQKLCNIQMLLNIENMENKTKNVLKNDWWIRILIIFIYN